MRKCVAAGILLFILLLCTEAFAGVVKLKNGDELTGRIVKRTDTHIEIETRYGKLVIPHDKIESIQERVRVHLKEDRRMEGEIISRTQDDIKLKTGYGELNIPTKDIVRIESLDKERTGKKPPAKADLRALRRKAREHLQGKQWKEAVEVYKKILEIDPEDSSALYNCACACSLLDRKAEAIEYLRRAVEAGFIDFAHIERDPDLENIRGEEGYKELFAQKAQLLAGYAEKVIKYYRKKLGDEYRIKKDDKYKLIVISNVSEDALDRLIEALHAYAQCHWKDFFEFKPEYYITVLIPKNSQEYAKKFGGRSGAAGFYNPGSKTLTVNLATGTGTMIHEFTHALHYADMEGLGQRHPIWVIEGFGSLYEQCTRREGSGYGLLNWRLPILKRAIAGGECYPLKDFISKSSSYFRQSQSLSYAITRYVFYFLQEKKLLRKWYALYRKNFKKDRTGLKTLEEVYGKSIEEFEKDWLEFVKPLEYSRGRRRGPYIGVRLETMEEGLEILEVVEGGPADKAGLRKGDIILKIEDRETKTLDDLRGIVAKHKVGNEVRFVVKRAGEEKEITLKLGKR